MIDARMSKAIDDLAAALGSQMQTIFDGNTSVFLSGIADDLNCESPIENLFLFGLYTRLKWEQFHFAIYDAKPPATLDDARYLSCIHPRRPLQIFRQHGIAGFRADFLLAWARRIGDPSSVEFLGVECDGHDFHDKTKEQAQRDKARDRKILSHGVPIMRFTGSEIYRAPVVCGDEALRVFLKLREQVELDEMTATTEALEKTHPREGA
jgi:very-short-patch-repair endonuclease